MEAMDKIANSATRYRTKMLYCHVQNLRRSSQNGLVPVKDRKGTPSRDSESA